MMDIKESKLAGLNHRLLALGRYLVLEDYLKEARCALGVQIDDVFIQILTPLLDQDAMVIPHRLLVQYKVISGQNASAASKRLLAQYGLIEGKDFTCIRQASSPRGGAASKQYYLHPDAFELALIRSRNTKAYAAHYICLRRCVAGYKDYQAALRERQQAGELEALRAERKKDALELARLRAEAPPPRHATFLYRRDEPAPDLGCLYFIESKEAGLFKIGFTRRLPTRLRALQAGSPHELAVYRSVHCIGPAAYEALAHEHFAAARRRGEWFAVARETIDEFVAGLSL